MVLERINLAKKQIIYVAALFMLGPTFLIPPAQEIGSYGWIALTISYMGFLLLFSLYRALLNLAPDKSLFEILQLAFGRWLGLAFSLFYLFYFVFLLTLIVANFADFIDSVVLIHTPELVITIFLVATAAYAVRKGFESIARISDIILYTSVSIAFLVFLFLIDKISLDVFRPVWPSSWSPIFKSSLSVFAFPFGETVVFLSIFNQLGKPQKTMPSLLWGSLIAFISLQLVTVRNVATLGEFVKYSSYPSYDVARLVDIGNVISRAEILISINFLGMGYIKATTMYYSFCSGVAELFKLKSYKHLVLPVGVLVSLSSLLSFKTTIQNLYFIAEIYPYFVFVPQVIIIALAYIVLRVRGKKVG